jgi:tRNA nucleotidyltransferase (CCA-adding enzyme)
VNENASVNGNENENQKPFEITTYRVDGKYTDNRRPEKVRFVNVLKRDLARRDFTVNAMAYNPKTGLVDYYSGRQDLAERKIKCVGNPNKRFQEDALRIMRALRFASNLSNPGLGFSVEAETSKAMIAHKKLLNNIAAERIAGELNKLLMGNDVHTVILNHLPVITEIIPEFIPAVGFEQHNPYHCYDVMTHILMSVDNAPKDIVIRLAMFLHDIGKPHCYTETADKIGHFYRHPQISSDMAKVILSRLKYDNDTRETVAELILHHDADIHPEPKHIKRWLNKIGEKKLHQLIEIKKADDMSKSEKNQKKNLNELKEILFLTDKIIEQRQCFLLKDLAVNGSDLIGIGITGVKIGVVLNRLLDMVIDEKLENDKEALLETAKNL